MKYLWRSETVLEVEHKLINNAAQNPADFHKHKF